MNTFYITLTRRHFFGLFTETRTIENIKELLTLKDMSKCILIIYSDETREVINIDRYDSYFLPVEFFNRVKADVKKDSQGQANV